MAIQIQQVLKGKEKQKEVKRGDARRRGLPDSFLESSE